MVWTRVEEGTFQAPPGHQTIAAPSPHKDRTGAVKVAAGLNLAWGGLLVLGAVVAGVVMTSIAEAEARHGGASLDEMHAIRDMVVTVLLLVGTPYLVGGVAVFARQGWGRPLLFGVSGLGLLLFPVGTVVSLVSFWALTRPGAEPWFGGAP